jgi:hydrogenase nickel incorporation protein HypA/HybF
MHELALAESIVDMVAGHAASRRVRRITVEIGALACVMPDALRFCFGLAAAGTVLEGARLEIAEVRASARCRACGNTFFQDTFWTACPCGERDFERLTGEELRVKEYELDATAVT